jgi:hypothetical protein
MIGLGYIGAVITGYYFGALNTTSVRVGSTWVNGLPTAPNWPVAFVPLGHPFAMIGNYGGTAANVMWATELLGTALEIGGAIALALGIVGHPTTDGGLAVGPMRLRLSAPGAIIGASIGLEL